MDNDSSNNLIQEVFPSGFLSDDSLDDLRDRAETPPPTLPEEPETPPPDIELPEAFPGAVYRLFNTDTGVHLYTADVAERDSIIQNLSNYNYEGVAYFTAQSDGGVPVYRFYEPNLDIYLYTASEAERDSILDNLPNYTLQGESFTVFESEVEGTVPVYRFFIPDSGAFFYTANEAERDAVESLPNYTFEGVAFYGFASESGTNPDPEPTPDPITDPDPDRTGFDGAELTYQEFSPDFDTPTGDPFNIVVGDGVELDIADGELVETGVGSILDLDNNTLTYEINTDLAASTFAPGEFNGFIVADLTDNLPTITNVTIDPSTTLAIDAEDVAFVDDALAVNVENIPFSDGDIVRLNVDFAETTEDSEPVPPAEDISGSNFTGAEIQNQVLFPDLESPVGDPLLATVGDGVEFEVTASELLDDNTFVPGYNIDINSNSVLFTTANAPIDSPFYNEGEFNGFILSDISGAIPAIESVSINENETSLGIDASDVLFTEDTISVNLEGISYTPGEQVLIDVEFADI